MISKLPLFLIHFVPPNSTVKLLANGSNWCIQMRALLLVDWHGGWGTMGMGSPPFSRKQEADLFLVLEEDVISSLKVTPCKHNPSEEEPCILGIPRKMHRSIKNPPRTFSLSITMCQTCAKHLISVISSHPHKPITLPFYRWIARNREVTQLISNGSRRSNGDT